MPENNKVGIYIDVDNYVIPFNGRTDKVREGLQFIFETSEKEGTVVEARAYANYVNQPFWLYRLLCARGIVMVYTPQLNEDGKNIDDQIMARDITLAPYTRPEIGIIVVVSADGHFVPAISFARGCGRRVIVMCTDKPNGILKEAASEVITIGRGGQAIETSVANKLNENTLLGDIEALIKEHGTAFHRKSLIEALALKCNEVHNKEHVEVLVDNLIKKGALGFSMLNGSPSLQINSSALMS